MEEDEKKVLCQNCKVELPESKLAIHQGFCLRNNKYCPTCSKVFLVGEFEEHLKTHNIAKTKVHNKEAINKDKVNDKPKESSHRRNCPCPKHGYDDNQKKPPKEEIVPKKVEPPKKKPIHIDDSLGFQKCEFCENVVENLKEHLVVCEVKILIEKERADYYKALQELNEKDKKLAMKLAKEKEMNVDNDLDLAKKLQEELEKNKIMDIERDLEIAEKLHKEQTKIIDTNDEQLAKKLQDELDEKLAKELAQKIAVSNNTIPTETDEDVIKAIEASKNEQ